MSNNLASSTFSQSVAMLKTRPHALSLFFLVCAINFVFWKQLFDTVWQVQVVLLCLAIFSGFMIGYWWAEFRFISQLERVLDSNSKSLGNTGKDAVDQVISHLEHTQRELEAFRVSNADLQGRVQIVESCLGGLSFSWTIDSHAVRHINTVGYNFNRFFRISREEFLDDWLVVLPEIHDKDRKAVELFLSRYDAFPAKESITFQLAKAAHESNRYLQMTVRREMEMGVLRVFGVLVDVTELMLAKQQAHTEYKAKSDFLATISHELRTPLNSIIGFSRLLKTQLDHDSELQQDAASIVDAGESLHVILNDILDYNRIQAEGVRLHNEPFDLNELLSSIWHLNKPVADQKGIQFNYVNRCSDNQTLLGDVNRLRQVFQNLVSNALKFTDEGYVEIRLYGSPPKDSRMQVVVEIADTGVGIGRAEMDRLFKPFSQASREVNRRFGGTGLGLAISSGLVERMGGTIDITSEPDVGSVFSVQLNLALSQKSKQNEKPVNANHAPIHILVVDDHPLNLKLLDRFLKKSGHSVVQADSGKLAVELAEKEEFDLILMDIDMPEMDGHEATTAIKNGDGKSRNTPICAVSGLVDEQTKEKSFSVGMCCHLSKPISFSELRRVILQVSHAKHGDQLTGLNDESGGERVS